MSVIGQAIIEVIGDAQKFPASVEEGVKPGLAAAEAETSVSGEKMGSNLKGKFGSAFGGIGSIAKVAIGVGVAEAFKTGFEKVEADQTAMARLEAGLKSTGDTAGLSSGEMEKLAGSIQGYSGQTKESILDTEQLLIRFKNVRDVAGKNNDIFTQTTKLAADMAARMGGDASSQATKLGRALEDPAKGMSTLTRVGAIFTDQQKAQAKALEEGGVANAAIAMGLVNSTTEFNTVLKANHGNVQQTIDQLTKGLNPAQKQLFQHYEEGGHVMEAQKLILGQLNNQYAGSAKAVGETLPGKIKIAKLGFEDLAGNLVSSMLPVFNILISVVGVLTPVLAAVAPILAPLAIGIFAVVGAVKAWNAVQEAFNVVMDANPIILVVAAIAILVVAIVAAYQHSATFRDIVKEAFQVIKDAASALASAFKASMAAIVEAFHIVEDALKAVGNAFRSGFDVVRNLVEDVVGFIRDHWQLLIGILTGPIDIVVVYIVTHFNQILDTAQSVVNGVIGFFKNLVSFVTTLPGKIASAASGMWDGIKAAFREAIDWIIMGWNSLHFHVPGFSVGPIHFGGFDLGLPQIPLLATGGAFNGMAIVGEHGPELVRGAGTVYSRQDTEKMLGSGVTIHPGAFAIHIHGNADKKDVDTALRQWTAQLSTSLRRRGVVPA